MRCATSVPSTPVTARIWNSGSARHENELVRFSRELVPAALDLLRTGESPRGVMRKLGLADPAYRDLARARRPRRS